MMSTEKLQRANLVEAMTTQRAVRDLLPETVDVAEVVRCIELAIHAPNGSNAQRWHWILVSDDATKTAIANLNRPYAEAYVQNADGPAGVRAAVGRQADAMHAAPLIVVPCYRMAGPLDDHPARCAFYGSIFPAVQNFLLALHAAGLGATLTTMALRDTDVLGGLLRLPKDVLPCAVLPVGIPAREPTTRSVRGRVDEVCHDGAFGRPLDGSFDDRLTLN